MQSAGQVLENGCDVVTGGSTRLYLNPSLSRIFVHGNVLWTGITSMVPVSFSLQNFQGLIWSMYLMFLSSHYQQVLSEATQQTQAHVREVIKRLAGLRCGMHAPLVIRTSGSGVEMRWGIYSPNSVHVYLMIGWQRSVEQWLTLTV